MATNKADALDLIRETGVIAIMRAHEAEGLLAAAGALLEGGVRVIEVTMTTAGALDVITAARRRYGDRILFGAGTVLDGETARACILAGAQFIVAPTLKRETIQAGNRYGVPVLPGCYTPTECLTAWEEGASMIKLFPATNGGPAYLKAILAPLPQLEIVPVGGVERENVVDFIRAGAVAVGIGSYLVNQKLLAAGDRETIRQRAATLINEVQLARRA